MWNFTNKCYIFGISYFIFIDYVHIKRIYFKTFHCLVWNRVKIFFHKISNMFWTLHTLYIGTCSSESTLWINVKLQYAYIQLFEQHHIYISIITFFFLTNATTFDFVYILHVILWIQYKVIIIIVQFFFAS